jgi:glucose-6-phosphate dehydrogenase assembly protein OpcA
MSTNAAAVAEELLPLAQVERVLSSRLGQVKGDDGAPLLRARLSNLVIFCNQSSQAEVVGRAVNGIVTAHPARVLFLVGESSMPGDSASEAMALRASLLVRTQLGAKSKLCSEQVTLRAGGQHVDQLPFAVRQLLIGDLPTNLWWAAPIPPPLAGHLLYDLAEHAQQIIYDSIGWMEPARGVVATSAWLQNVQRTVEKGPWRVAADLNWRRLKSWRRVLSQALDPNTAPGALDSINEVVVEHGPHAVIQAWELVSWLASRLGWKVQLGKVEPNVEIAWQVVAPHGLLLVRIRRLSEGPSEVRKVRISCNLDGAPHVLNVAAQEDKRLAVVLEGRDAAPRTMAVQQPTLAELVISQLSNRECDPVFRESMAVAEVFAKTVLQ